MFSRDTFRGTAVRVADAVGRQRPDDLIIVSVHWGSNWGYDVPEEQRRFAHALIDKAGVSVVHGHSSHHPKAIEVYRDRLILYGCGDFLNDYEGIKGYEELKLSLCRSETSNSFAPPHRTFVGCSRPWIGKAADLGLV